MNAKPLHMGPDETDAWKLSISGKYDGLVMGMVGPVCVAIWRTKPVRHSFEAQRMELAAAVASNPGKAAFMCVVEAEADPPDQAIRDASAKMISSHGKKLAACACVIEGAGFRAAITRTVLGGIALVARNAAPTRFFESVPLASDWLLDRLGSGQQQRLAEQVELARKHLEL